EELQPCIHLMVDHLVRPLADEFVYRKYQHRQYLKASLFCREWVARHGHEMLQALTPPPPVGHFAPSEAAVNSVD
ncbi:hypothetical protein GGI23_006309, partial [Coemansia sp. RSA 2559]